MMISKVKVIRDGPFLEIWNHEGTERLKIAHTNRALEIIAERDWIIVDWSTKLDLRVAAIRSDLAIGKGSNSVINFWRDEDLMVSLDGASIHTSAEAVTWAKEQHHKWEERYKRE